jgi:inorganic pyrophosphatase
MSREGAAFRQVISRSGSRFITELTLDEVGKRPSMDYRMFLKREGKVVSPWHDVPLLNKDNSFNMIVEIPKFTRAKMEIATSEVGNPIKQDVKKGKLREYSWGDMCFNYGALPQTWEDPEHVNPYTGAGGDNDPVDVIDIGSIQYPMGAVVKVRPLGVLAMVDDGETDWKVVAINTEDPLAHLIHSLSDVERLQPGVLSSFREWMRLYKTTDGKPENHFAFDGQYQGVPFTVDMIAETHKDWKKLVDGGRREL